MTKMRFQPQTLGTRGFAQDNPLCSAACPERRCRKENIYENAS